MPKMGILKKKPLETATMLSPARAKRERAKPPRPILTSASPRAISGVASALFSNTQQRVLGLLFGQPDRTFFATEIIGLTGAGSGATQRELARLDAAALVTTSRLGNQKHYQANAASPIFSELVSIISKTVGLAEPLRAALSPLAKRITVAFVYGSVAKQRDTAGSDIDIMILADKVSYADVYAALEVAEARLGRRISPTMQTPTEWTTKLLAKNAFTVKVNAQPKLFLIGDEVALG